MGCQDLFGVKSEWTCRWSGSSWTRQRWYVPPLQDESVALYFTWTEKETYDQGVEESAWQKRAEPWRSTVWVIEERLIDICNGFAAHNSSGQNENIKASPFRNSSINERFATLDREGVCLDSDSVTLTYGFDVIDYGGNCNTGPIQCCNQVQQVSGITSCFDIIVSERQPRPLKWPRWPQSRPYHWPRWL